jgi:hypothetical protein
VVVAALVILAGGIFTFVQPGFGSAQHPPSRGVHHPPLPDVKAQVRSDLRSASTAEQTYFTDNGEYTTSVSALAQQGFAPSGGDVVTVASANGSRSYCIEGTAAQLNGTSFYYSSNVGGLSTRPCSANE